MNKDFKIGIIGGGPAGSTIALRLSRAGFPVCLFEKNEFPREVLCGEFLSKEVVDELKDLDLYESFLDLRPNRINSFRFVNDNSAVLNTDFQFESFAIKRSVFDSFLLEEAKLSGAMVYQPAEVKRVKRENGKFIIEIKDADNNPGNFETDIVIAAYGKKNILDKQLMRKFTNQKSGLNGLKFHIDRRFIPGFLNSRIEIYSAPGIYCGLNAVSEDEVTMCLLEDRKEFNGSPVDHLSLLFDHNSSFRGIFSKDFDPLNIRAQAYGTGNIYFGKRELVKDGIIMAGDAAGVIAPLAGDGIGMALQTGKIINDILKIGYPEKINPGSIARIFEKEWEKKFRKRIFTAGLIQQMIMGNRVKNTGIKFAKHFPFILPLLVKNTRG